VIFINDKLRDSGIEGLKAWKHAVNSSVPEIPEFLNLFI
jgi:hypothetical protein